MKQSKLLMPTLRDIPAEAEVKSHQLLLKAGYIRPIAAGMFSYLPLAKRVLNKIETIIREEMDKIDANEMLVPEVLPAELWQRSGRYETYGPALYKFKNRQDRDFILGPTHEETFTQLIADEIKSYKKLPLTVYQIQAKFRDENRPRFGLLRTREFIMKDAYSFSADQEGLDEAFHNMEEAYTNIFDRLGLEYRAIVGDAGAMGGSDSKEFSAPAAAGEDTIAYSDATDYAANLEMAKDFYERRSATAEQLALEKISTPNEKTIDDVATLLDKPKNELVKTIMFVADDELVAVVTTGDFEVNEVKVQNYLHADSLVMAEEADVRKAVGAGFGSLGPVGLPEEVKLLVDERAADLANFAAGANEDGMHYVNINWNRDVDLLAENVSDFRTVREGDLAIDGKGKLQFTSGIEIGHIFKLGTRYSKTLGAQVLDNNGRQTDVIMGSYGIGVSRLLSAIAEQKADEDGLVWPASVAPFDIHIVPINMKDEDQARVAEQLETLLVAQGMEVLVDDRKERAGVKFADADLIGLPIRITVGKKADEDVVEVKVRASNTNIEMRVSEVVDSVSVLLNASEK
ncbi:prolyl-tRNA synthetase [Leuconostoc mesenteroides subsp. dextranicum]|jgi:prolyl-tRNA synthetase|uniref:Proline--tRNA ligase n=1 Tax=Leuconostoc mesenteroides subsp. mesenteroides (strain ATCC 8293 / DSM 20343 / BCRC 11652 / CCM 1803 / JCM 6124 / NCDO 523 / NBRC 100496 / NCIMB 8023 / NCTC 12954 / NRRL B-1118 / 37Y) TaxID=203120 RepID=SYP_LEUMM|nr:MULTISPECIES: proline--tRNA ligase [Leuconostoc]Q03YC4.1 RecName: Full=Proline--tRNA ligase; AltName: Full=Prolyl-tRNA synthetase; Short=ProRS [Leuconostoc mesenteroides subsp. mesenteroides ATCC 8293]ABJ61798.1 Prolyl-tRNA synthetase [Leuconostoc mesenteroides subsp. mesenteroides ATCC 8293]KMY78422.1 prolyl-tRNA synthetase [Leuconostoc mesenteroides subsp. mesenteroides]KMY82116.1 prolyl-tRNA synthetase [Leuconostoc mesenteroides subsp. dextranicum]MBZ1501906.1 proline--tRNA ligase [Leuco